MAEEFKKLNPEELGEVAGGVHGKVGLYDNGPWKTVKGLKSGYLAIRSEPAYDARNELGKLYNGNSVQVIGNCAYTGNSYDPLYTWVWAPNLNISGWVNSNFIG